MKRLPDWRARLVDYLHACWRRPFEYGVHDCATFAAGAVHAMTGEDLAAPYRGRYADTDGGLVLLNGAGYTSPLDMVAAMFPRVPVSMAQAGDLAAFRTPEGPATGIVQGYRIYFVGLRGIMTMDLLDARAAFRV